MTTTSTTSIPTAVLFLDICGSTSFFDRHGEKAGKAMVERCFRLVLPQIEKREGRVVKRMGDGLLAVFPTASALVSSAADTFLRLDAMNEAVPEPARIRIHCGGDWGPVVVDSYGDIFGDVANTASRVESLAGADRLYVTHELVNELAEHERDRVRAVGKFALRGKAEEVPVYEVLWKSEGSTMLVSRETLNIETRLTLFLEGQVIEFPSDKKTLAIGRIPGNDVVVDDAAVSREHAEITRRKGSFIFVDRSTNGTYLRQHGAKPRHLHREECRLEDSGNFALGRADGPAVEYKVT
ncbi:MAG: adenylate cyclase [Candidatus Binatota bacterium]|nr:adenylate cyclase [Candidatus Binatota bacterium]